MNGSAITCSLRGFQILIGSVDLDALKIPARKAEYSLTENALSPYRAEPTQVGQRPNWLLSPSPANNQSTLTRRHLLWLGPSGSFMDFGFSAGFFLNSSIEEELDLFIQRN